MEDPLNISGTPPTILSGLAFHSVAALTKRLLVPPHPLLFFLQWIWLLRGDRLPPFLREYCKRRLLPFSIPKRLLSFFLLPPDSPPPCIEIPMFLAPSFPLSFLLLKSICWSSRASYRGGGGVVHSVSKKKKRFSGDGRALPRPEKKENEEKGTNTAFLPPNSRHFPNKNIFSSLRTDKNFSVRAFQSSSPPLPLLQTHTYSQSSPFFPPPSISV